MERQIERAPREFIHDRAGLSFFGGMEKVIVAPPGDLHLIGRAAPLFLPQGFDRLDGGGAAGGKPGGG